MKIKIIFLFLSASIFIGCSSNNKIRGPIWNANAKNTDIIGIGANTVSLTKDKANVHGVRFQAIGIGAIAPIIPPRIALDSPNINKSNYHYTVNGLDLSGTGTWAICKVNGLSIAPIGSIKSKVNGVSGTLCVNYVSNMNGLQVSCANASNYSSGIQLGIKNQSRNLKGLQLGLFNASKEGKGLQIGLWNSNKKRSLPLINWVY